MVQYIYEKKQKLYPYRSEHPIHKIINCFCCATNSSFHFIINVRICGFTTTLFDLTIKRMNRFGSLHEGYKYSAKQRVPIYMVYFYQEQVHIPKLTLYSYGTPEVPIPGYFFCSEKYFFLLFTQHTMISHSAGALHIPNLFFFDFTLLYVNKKCNGRIVLPYLLGLFPVPCYITYIAGVLQPQPSFYTINKIFFC